MKWSMENRALLLKYFVILNFINFYEALRLWFKSEKWLANFLGVNAGGGGLAEYE